MNKVYIECSSQAYKSLFEAFSFEVVHTPEVADLVCFTGGSDVTPSLYGDKAHRSTGNFPARDEKERVLFNFCLDKGIPMVGICRGGQFLNVMSGGRMYQDVMGHCYPHDIIDAETGEIIHVSSTHHQMMMPSDKAAIIATSVNVNSEREWFDQQVFRKDVSKEGIEVVYYPHTNCLCFQPHPEFVSPEYTRMREYFHTLLEGVLNVCGAEYI